MTKEFKTSLNRRRLMKILIINCSPVRNGATAEMVNVVKDNVSAGNEVRSICIDDYEIALCKE